MRRSLRGTVRLAATGMLAAAALSASASAQAENRLLGIKIWNTYKQVLAKLGQPTSIEPGDVTSTGAGGGGAAFGATLPGGGMMAMSGPAGMMQGGGGRAMTGMDDDERPGGMMPGGGLPGGARGGMGLPGISGMSAPPGLARGGLPGTSGPPPGAMGGYMAMMMGAGRGGVASGPPPGVMSGGPGGMMIGAPGAMAGGTLGGNQAARSSESEVTWIYKRGNNTHRVLFNRDGRVIQIESFGYSGGGATTERGISLGAPLSSIYARYGWTANVSKSNDSMTLNYGRSHNVIFYLLDRGSGYKVVGISVALTEKDDIPAR